MKPEILDICLRDVNNSTEALRTLYQQAKASHPSCSLAYLCKKSGISSTGYLSDVLKGRRTLNKKYFAGLCKAFGLTANASICLRLLLDIDHEKDENKKKSLKIQLTMAQKSLNVSYHSLDSLTRELFDALEVFCAFGIFHNSVTLAQIHAVFSKTRSSESIDASLEYLKTLGLVKNNESSLVVTQEHVIFQQVAGGIAPTDFIRLALAHAMANVEQWFPSPQSAFFTSTMLSVNKKNFESLLREFKAYTLSTQASMESKDADTLVRFNVQVYPMGEKLN
jgi:uncharacterized protein (TIGR02147 family)